MDQSNLNFDSARLFPMMALRGLTIFPGMMMNFDVERSGSIAALDRAMKDDQIIFLFIPHYLLHGRIRDGAMKRQLFAFIHTG